MKNLKLPFENSENLISNHSQAGQDLFVLMCLDGKRNGTFLDLGCNEPIFINNTYLLENNFDWNGVSIDIDPRLTSLYQQRKTKVFTQDCTKLDFNEIKTKFNTNHIDYLSLDLEPASVTYECLKNLPLNEIEFSVITYEHDFYRFGDFWRKESRNLLSSFGYKLICSNVIHNGNIFEDWYVNPKYVPLQKSKILETDLQNWDEIIFN